MYYQPKAPSTQEVQAKRRIDEIYTAHPFLGSRKITVLLRNEMRISRPTVQHYMRKMGITAIYPAPRLSQPHPDHTIYPYLLRNLVIERPNQIWDLDYYFHPPVGWLALSGGCSGLVLAVCGQLGAESEPGDRFRLVGDRPRPTAGCPGNMQHRSGQSIHQPALYRKASGGWCPDQHGWPRPRDGQHLHGTALAQRQIRGGLSA